MDYRTAGVDVLAGRAFVDRIRASVESTRRPEVLGGLGGFGGLCRLGGDQIGQHLVQACGEVCAHSHPFEC